LARGGDGVRGRPRPIAGAEIGALDVVVALLAVADGAFDVAARGVERAEPVGDGLATEHGRGVALVLGVEQRLLALGRALVVERALPFGDDGLRPRERGVLGVLALQALVDTGAFVFEVDLIELQALRRRTAREREVTRRANLRLGEPVERRGREEPGAAREQERGQWSEATHD